MQYERTLDVYRHAANFRPITRTETNTTRIYARDRRRGGENGGVVSRS